MLRQCSGSRLDVLLQGVTIPSFYGLTTSYCPRRQNYSVAVSPAREMHGEGRSCRRGMAFQNIFLIGGGCCLLGRGHLLSIYNFKLAHRTLTRDMFDRCSLFQATSHIV